MAQSDLLPENITLGSITVAPGASLSVDWLLANQGSGAANSTSTTELRINQSSTSAAGTDLIGVSTAALAAGASVSQSATLTAPCIGNRVIRPSLFRSDACSQMRAS